MRDVALRLLDSASQENCDGEPYDTMMAAYVLIRSLERRINKGRKMIFIQSDDKREEFAREASGYFKQHPDVSTYTSESVEPGALFAFRWNKTGGVCVITIGDDEPICYTGLAVQAPQEWE